ncbi:hypothetical protein ASPBRDRAFT_203497 [Aspergillus brasiliensis CBS 101740]|uniref:Uncharacterized protein n=1 Tax=Aspergillus brasiliensis (strain CBS 101740 / IMI 381727 / IBT 21946) TaxID=767769 RepID=A0A1L9UW04_ASPBC|nr:hypothetical protein ASPBRDRAFT_203497 [Aspergillus brasiliensis CBS 101740]
MSLSTQSSKRELNVRNRLGRKGINSKGIQQARQIEDPDPVVGPIIPEKTEKTDTPAKEPKDVPDNPKAESKPAKAKTDTKTTMMKNRQQQQQKPTTTTAQRFEKKKIAKSASKKCMNKS